MKKSIIIILLLIFTILFANGTYSYYVAKFSRTKESNKKTSYVTCDFDYSIDNSHNKWGYQEIKVIVKNYDSSQTSLHKLNYIITVENVDGEALFGYNNVFSENATASGSFTTTSSETSTHYFQIKSVSGLAEDVNFKINLECKQSQ